MTKQYSTPCHYEARSSATEYADWKENIKTSGPRFLPSRRTEIKTNSNHNNQFEFSKPQNYQNLEQPFENRKMKYPKMVKQLSCVTDLPDHHQDFYSDNDFSPPVLTHCQSVPISKLDDTLNEFSKLPHPDEPNKLNKYLALNNNNAKCLPVSLIKKNKTPFCVDKSQCREHKQPLRYIWLAHGNEEEKWCELWVLPPGCSIIDMKKRAEVLKDAVRVESFFFNNSKPEDEDEDADEESYNHSNSNADLFFDPGLGGDQENIKQNEGILSKIHARMNGDTIDSVFNVLYDSLSNLQQDLKTKNKPSKKEINIMEQMVK